jgi:hypothetical protein
VLPEKEAKNTSGDELAVEDGGDPVPDHDEDEEEENESKHEVSFQSLALLSSIMLMKNVSVPFWTGG